MSHRTKTLLFLGIVAALAIIVGYIIYSRIVDNPSLEYTSPALSVSKERAKQNSSKTPSKNPSPTNK